MKVVFFTEGHTINQFECVTTEIVVPLRLFSHLRCWSYHLPSTDVFDSTSPIVAAIVATASAVSPPLFALPRAATPSLIPASLSAAHGSENLEDDERRKRVATKSDQSGTFSSTISSPRHIFLHLNLIFA